MDNEFVFLGNEWASDGTQESVTLTKAQWFILLSIVSFSISAPIWNDALSDSENAALVDLWEVIGAVL